MDDFRKLGGLNQVHHYATPRQQTTTAKSVRVEEQKYHHNRNYLGRDLG